MSDFLDSYLTTGGVDDELVTFRNAKFTTDIQYRDGQEPFLCVDICPDSPDVSELTEVRIALGQGWEQADDEASVSRIDGKKAMFNTSSKVGRLLDSLSKDAGFKQAVEARIAAGDTPASPLEAAFWEGLRGTIHRNEASFTPRDGGGEQTFSFYTMTDVEGWEGSAKPVAKKAVAKNAPEKAAEAKPAKKAAAKKAAAVKEEPVEESTETPAGGGLDEFRAKLLDHCKATEAAEHADWMLEAYETFADELTTGGDEYQALVDNESEVWAEAWG